MFSTWIYTNFKEYGDDESQVTISYKHIMQHIQNKHKTYLLLVSFLYEVIALRPKSAKKEGKDKHIYIYDTMSQKQSY